MSRFSFSMSSLFAVDAPHSTAPVRRWPELPTLIDDDETQCGPGWFESSRDLQRGLLVREGLPGDLAAIDWAATCQRSATP